MDQLSPEQLIVRVLGIVQGVGFRPFVLRAARERGLTGSVRNRSGHVEIRAFGSPGALSLFLEDIRTRAPAGSRIRGLEIEKLPYTPGDAPPSFRIAESEEDSFGTVTPSPDLAVCPDCLGELFTPGDPRYRNPFISCTNCGPRYSIMRRAPYDRVNTSMDCFPLCPLCRTQYEDPGDRRHHAQTLCCNACGPVLSYRDTGGQATGESALQKAVAALQGGAILAIKGIGGYHLACSPFDFSVVEKLRGLKGREHKPFAVIFETLSSLSGHCEISGEESAWLLSAARPIVLLHRKSSSALSPNVYTDSPRLGAFLPYTPLQHLILRETGPLVMTSMNRSGEPMVYEDREALHFFETQPELGGILSHDRPILRPLDDSVMAVVLEKPQMIRRARGFVPVALPSKDGGPPLLALGPQQKNTVCFYNDGLLFPSAETGDLDSLAAEKSYRHAIGDMGSLLKIQPERLAYDLHPEYVSTKTAKEMGLPAMAVQHHHAHIASVMAEHELDGPVIGVAFDGTGYGTDRTIWGGEFLIVSKKGFSRAGNLNPVRMLGGDASVRQCWKSAACMMYDAGIPLPENDAARSLVYAALENKVNAIQSSSMGRLFDAVSALLSLCEESSYDGQGAVALENAAATYLSGGNRREARPFSYTIEEKDGRLIADFSPGLREIYAQKDGDSGQLAWRFHLSVSRLICEMCGLLSEKSGIKTVALSGGVFLNRLLLEDVIPRLIKARFAIYRNEKVPAGDGGISLGQTRVALWEISEKGKD